MSRDWTLCLGGFFVSRSWTVGLEFFAFFSSLDPFNLPNIARNATLGWGTRCGPSGAEAQVFVELYGTAEAVPFPKSCDGEFLVGRLARPFPGTWNPPRYNCAIPYEQHSAPIVLSHPG